MMYVKPKHWYIVGTQVDAHAAIIINILYDLFLMWLEGTIEKVSSRLKTLLSKKLKCIYTKSVNSQQMPAVLVTS